MISVWSGREAHALREALRMSIDDFAVHLGASRRGVAKWSVRGSAVKLRWDTQRALDAALAKATSEQRKRLQQLLALPSERSPDAKVSRRAVCASVAATLGDVLISPPEPTGAAPPALIRLEQRVARVRMGYQAGRYSEVIAGIPALTQALTEARADAGVRFPARVRRLASGVHHVTASLLLKLGDLPLAMLAAERCGQEAAASGDPLAVAAAARAGTRVLMRSGHQDRAATMATRAAEALRQTTGLAGPRPLSAYGALMLGAAVAAGRSGDRAGALMLLDDAGRAAQQLGMEGNFGWTAFGPTNVALHRVSVLLALNDAESALREAASVDPEAIAQAERRASFYVDIAHACHLLDRHAASVAALQRAYTIAPEEVRLRPATRQLAAALAETGSGPPRCRAAQLAELVLSR